MLIDGHPVVFPRDGLPSWPCGFDEPYLLPTNDIAWRPLDALIVVFAPDEARGAARRLLELADEADARSIAG